MSVLRIGSSGVFGDPIDRNLSVEEYETLSRFVDTSHLIHRTGARDEIEFFLRVKEACFTDEDRKLLSDPYETQRLIAECIVRSTPKTRSNALSPVLKAVVDYVRDWYDEEQQPLRGAYNEGYINVLETQTLRLEQNGENMWLFKVCAKRDCQKAPWLSELPVIH